MSTDSSFDTPEHFEQQSTEPPQSRNQTDQQGSGTGGLMDRAWSYADANRGQLLTTLGNAAKANPIAAALTALGVLGLVAASRSSASGSSAAGLAQSAPGSARERIRQTAERMKSGTAQAGDSTSTTARPMRPGVDGLLPEDPVLLAVMGLVVGAALGAVLPSTRQERKLADLARDKLSLGDTDAATDGDKDRGSRADAERLTRPTGMAGIEGSDIVGDETDSLLARRDAPADRP